MRMLKLSIANSRKLSAKMDDYEQGITVNTVGDDRTTQDKLEDENYMGRDFRDKVYTLFNNDPKQSEAYIEKAKARGMTPQGFNVAYPQLVQLFKGTLASADIVFNNTVQLIHNFESTGNTIQASSQSIAKSIREIDDIYDFIEESYDEGLLSKSKGDTAADKLNELEDILSMSPNDATEGFTNAQMSNMKQGIAHSVEEIVKVINTATITPDQKLSILLKELHSIKHTSVGIHRNKLLSASAREQIAKDKIRKVAENKAARNRTQKAVQAIKAEKDLDRELTQMGRADKAKWDAKEKAQKAAAKAKDNKSKAEAKEKRDLEKELDKQFPSQPKEPRRSSRIPKLKPGGT